MPVLLTADDPGLELVFGPPQWGIFSQEGAPILTVNSVDSIEYARDYRVSDAPQEKGAFESYNKVQTPYHAKVGFLIGDTRVPFLNTIEAAVASLDLVAVVTPEISYPSANLVHYGYRREARGGKTLIRVDVWCEEIRVVGEATLSTTAAPATQSASTPASLPNAQSTNAATPTQSGQVQPIDPTASGGNGTVLLLQHYAGVEPPT